MDIDSVGNRLADYQANLARQKEHQTFPLNLCELYLHLLAEDGQVVINDPRRTSPSQIRTNLLHYWHSKPPNEQGQFSSPEMLVLGRFVLKDGSPTQQITLVHIATNSIHFHWVQTDDGNSILRRVQCQICRQDLTIKHLLLCPTNASRTIRMYFRDEILAYFYLFDDCRPWLYSAFGHLQLPQLLLRLFPPPISAKGDGINDHILLCFVGAISTSLLRHASIAVLKFQDPNNGRRALNRFRLQQLTLIQNIYSKLKAASS